MTLEPITLLEKRLIVLAVTGSIAAYKAADLASKLTQVGAVVDVILTESAQQFVTPLTFQSVTGRPVYSDLWQAAGSEALPTHIAHVGLGERADLLVVAPATANTLAKLAHGMADDMLTLTALAAKCPVVVAPAMDGAMYQHPATQDNIRTLQARDVYVVEPEEGRFASGLVGKGRLPETPTLIGAIRRALGRHGLLAGRKVVVTAGGTREPLDPVRFITNRSSGKQGYALAQAAIDAGAYVVLVSAAHGLETPVGATLMPVNTAEEMLNAVLEQVVGADALLMAAAVADFRPETIAEQKIKKADDNKRLDVRLERTADILQAVKRRRSENGWPRVVVGFAAESENLLENSRAKLESKGLDLLVANDISAEDAGFEVDTNRVVILDAQGGQQPLELTSKARVSEFIVQRVVGLLSAV